MLARAVQGIGGAILTPLTLTILSGSVPEDRRGTVIGAWGGIGSLGAALGPVVGGALTTTIGWQSIFWLNVPIGLLLLPAARWRLTQSYGPRRPLDLPGVAMVSISLFALVGGVIRGSGHGWTNGPVLLGIGAGGRGLGLVAFVLRERRAPEPMLPVRLFRNRTFTTANIASLLMYSAAFGALFLIAQLLQTGLGADPLQAGLRTLPLAVMPVLLAPLGGALSDRIGNRPLMITALSLVTVAFAWLAIATRPGVPYLVLLPALVLMGAGLPLFWAPIANTSLGAARPQEQAQASGTSIAIRELAIVLGVAMLASTFAAHGDHTSPTNFLSGFTAAMWLAVALASTGVLVTLALPVPPRPHTNPLRLPAWIAGLRDHYADLRAHGAEAQPYHPTFRCATTPSPAGDEPMAPLACAVRAATRERRPRSGMAPLDTHLSAP